MLVPEPTGPSARADVLRHRASIDGARDSGWRSEQGTARADDAPDALFDTAPAAPESLSAMDGLLMLGLAAAEAQAAQAASLSSQDPAATAVLAEVLDDGRVDQLIDAIAGVDALHRAPAEGHAIDLAQFLDAPVANDLAVFVQPTADLEMQQLASA